MSTKHRFGVVTLISVMVCAYGFPIQLGAAENAEAFESDTDLADLSLEELMDMEITSVSKKEERLFNTGDEHSK